ncbi:tyrosine-type recombinase/integrase [Candidatus Uabimicrobium helgolandensis]
MTKKVKKPKPAPIPNKKSGSFRLHFYYNGKQYRSRYIRDENIANALQGKINSMVIQFKNGLLHIPEETSIKDFIFGCVQPPKPKEETKPKSIPTTTLSQLLAEYIAILQPPIKAQTTCDLEKIHIRHLQRFVKQQGYNDPLLTEINVGFFNRYKMQRYKKVQPDTVKKELLTFQSAFRVAVENKYIEHNVVKDVQREKSNIPCERFRTQEEINQTLQSGNCDEKKKKEICRFRYLTPPEIKELTSLAKGKWLYPVLKTFAYTGIRRGELIDLKWENVDLERRIIYVASKKQSNKLQKVTRHIPICEELHKVLLLQKSKTNYWVFPNRNGQQLSKHTLTNAVRSLVRDTEFEGIGTHTFRHSLASNLASIGEDQRIIDKILGHQTEAMRQRYQHLFPRQLKTAIDNLGYM